MLSFFSYLLVAAACLLGIAVAVLLVEIVAAVARSRKRETLPSISLDRGRIAVVVPAHNESAGLLPTIRDIKAQLRASDRLIVVADNCADDTAAVAAAAGAETIERNEPAKTGKGFALDFAVKHLGSDPPAAVIFIDADCRVEEGAIERLAATCLTANRPVQALDLMTAPDESKIDYRAAEFAWRVKNLVRPLGLKALNLPCQLMGTGMAFPWNLIRSIDLAHGSIVEDLKLGLELAEMGNPPLFCPAARVTSRFPLSAEGATTQRLRWEGGHIGMILTTAPRYLFKAVVRANPGLLALALDLAVPPLSLLVLSLAALLALAALAALLGASSAALLVCAITLVALALAILLSWLAFGRDLLPPAALFSLASYALAKLRIYNQLMSGSGPRWTRTDRTK